MTKPDTPTPAASGAAPALPTDAMIHAAAHAFDVSNATFLVKMRCALSAALARQEAAPAKDGYATAFYEIASVLGIGARADTPENVFRNEMLPRIVALASREAGKDWSETEQSALNDWFLALPEGRRKALLEGDRWMLAGAAFLAGRAAQPASPAPLTVGERAELDQLRLLAGGNACIPEVQRVLGPISLWSAQALQDHIDREVAAALASPQVAPAPSNVIAYKFQAPNGSYWYIKADDERTIAYWKDKRKLIPLTDSQAKTTAKGTIYEPDATDDITKAFVASLATPVQVAPQPTETMTCEDCGGSGVEGEAIYQGEFQPPEHYDCSSCGGSGLWPVAPQDGSVSASCENGCNGCDNCVDYEGANSAPAFPALVAPQDDARDAATGNGLDAQIKRAQAEVASWSPEKRKSMRLQGALPDSTPAAKPTEPTLPTQGEQSHD